MQLDDCCRYILELCYKEASMEGNETELNVAVNVRMYETPYTALQTGDALNEEIRVRTTSNVVPEEQVCLISVHGINTCSVTAT